MADGVLRHQVLALRNWDEIALKGQTLKLQLRGMVLREQPLVMGFDLLTALADRIEAVSY